MRGDMMHGDPNVGVWGRPTSQLNFCELDYVVVPFLAEFVNTLTNLAYVHRALRRPDTGRHDVMSASLIVVGITSAVYHATLLQPAQYADDLSMLVLTGSLLQPLYITGASAAVARRVPLVLWSTVAAISAWYVVSRDYRIHRNTFGLMLTLVWPRTLYLIYGKGRSQAERARYLGTFGRAVMVLVLAFGLWNVDLHYCLELRAIRQRVGLPWAWLLELHGYWHVLTAVGAAEYIRLIRSLTR